MELQSTPWLNSNGSVKSDAELKEICQGWAPKVWEEYLKNFESCQNEFLTPDVDIFRQDPSQSCIELYKSLLAQEEFPELKKVVHAALCSLSAQEQKVIRSLYWEGLSQREAAKTLNLAKTSLSIYRERALKKLADFLLSGAIKKGVHFLKTIH
jgi:RNA polymerase sigma factor (sigma-70 family)